MPLCLARASDRSRSPSDIFDLYFGGLFLFDAKEPTQILFVSQ